MKQLSSKCEQQAYNVRSHRKKHSQQKIPINNSISNLSNSLCKEEQIYAKRLFSTAAISKRNHISDGISKAFAKVTIRKKTSEKSLQHKRSITCQLLDDNVNKKDNNLNWSKETIYRRSKAHGEKHIQNWLDHTLTNYCSDKNFTKANNALKHFEVDKNSLIAKGVSQNNIGRVYKSLYMYSTGFNDFLTSICQENKKNLKSRLWIVYSLLLQDCSEGAIKTALGDLQRQCTQKIVAMRQQINKMQSMLDQSEDNMKSKNAQLIKEWRQCKEEFETIKQEKNLIFQDFREAEQCFNNQVQLRLKFQGKINQIHGIHKELQLKHNKLFNDFIKKNEQLTLTQAKCQELKKDNFDLKIAYEQLVQNYQELTLELQRKKQQINNVQTQIKAKQLVQIEKQIIFKQSDAFLLNKLATLNNQSKNKIKAYNILHNQYLQLIKEGEHTVQTLKKQREQSNQLLFQKQHNNQNLILLQSQIIVLKQKNQQNQQLMFQLTTALNKQIMQKITALNEITSLKQFINMLQKQITQNLLKQKQLKRINQESQSTIKKMEKKEIAFLKIFQNKTPEIDKLKQEINKITNKNLTIQIEKCKIVSQNKLLKQQLLNWKQVNKKKASDFALQISSLEDNIRGMQIKLQNKQDELKFAAANYQQNNEKLRNQVFERTDLQLKYKQSLTVIESSSEQIKNLNRDISQFTLIEKNYSNKIKEIQLKAVQERYKLETEINVLKIYILEKTNKINFYSLFHHPMEYQDKISFIYQLTSRFKEKQLLIQNKQFQHTNQLLNIKNQMQHSSKKQFQTKILHQKQIEQKKQQIQYQQQKSLKLLKKLKQYQSVNKNISLTNLSRQQQQTYLVLIKQKTIRIEQLLKEVERIQDQNRTLLQRTTIAQQRVRDNQINNKREIQGQISRLQSRQSQLGKQSQSILSAKITPSSKKTERQQQLIDEQSVQKPIYKMEDNFLLKDKTSVHQRKIGRKIMNAYEYYNK